MLSKHLIITDLVSIVLSYADYSRTKQTEQDYAIACQEFLWYDRRYHIHDTYLTLVRLLLNGPTEATDISKEDPVDTFHCRLNNMTKLLAHCKAMPALIPGKECQAKECQAAAPDLGMAQELPSKTLERLIASRHKRLPEDRRTTKTPLSPALQFLEVMARSRIVVWHSPHYENTLLLYTMSVLHRLPPPDDWTECLRTWIEVEFYVDDFELMAMDVMEVLKHHVFSMPDIIVLITLYLCRHPLRFLDKVKKKKRNAEFHQWIEFLCCTVNQD